MKLTALAPVALIFCAALALAAGDWENSASVSVTVNGHAFHDVKVMSAGACKLTTKLLFDAPEKWYGDTRNKVRNYHLFQARVKFAKGQMIESKVFGNPAPGERVFLFDSDTTGDGCWSKAPNEIVKLEVIGCRGHSCDLGQFE